MKVSRHTQPRLLIVAAYDPSGGAGVLADCRAAMLMHTSPAACLTALTVQSSHRLERVVPLSASLLGRQLTRVTADDGPPAALKIGALTGTRHVQVLSRFLKEYPAPSVYDPVIAPSRGSPFIPAEERGPFRNAIKRFLLPRISLITPNLPEYRWLFGDMSPEDASRQIACGILLKGGHELSRSGTVQDRLYVNGRLVLTHSRPRLNVDIHGTGCVLASLIAGGLANDKSLISAVQFAEKRMNNLIRKASPAGSGAIFILLA